VVLEPKIRACLLNPNITDVLTPWQTGAKASVVAALATWPVRSELRHALPNAMVPGFASGRKRLRTHRCRHAAQSLIAIGDFTSKTQMATNAVALAVTAVMVLALPDIRNLLQPPTPPRAVAPGSPSPYYLWVSLDTDRPKAFAAKLESDFWSNRRANVFGYGGASGSVRAEIRLTRNAWERSLDELEGTVWIERRRTFLGREFQSGERVASFPIAYLTTLQHD
jgi:hypothetical protein